MRFPLEIVRRSRELVGDDFPIVYRISLLDLVEGGQTWDEVVELAHRLEEAGVTVLNTGIGWHEARVPTIITQVPRGAWRSATARLKAEVAGPGLRVQPDQHPRAGRGRSSPPARPTWSRWRARCWPTRTSSPRRRRGPRRRDQHLHRLQPGLPRPRLREPDGLLPGQPARLPRDHAGALPDPRAARPVAVVGAGPAGLARRGLRGRARLRGDAVRAGADEVGGQFRLAMQIPGKEDFAETLRYFTRRLEVLGVDVRLAHRGHRGRPRGVRRGGRRHRRRAADARHRGHRPPAVVSYADVLDGSRRARASGWRSSAPAASASTSAHFLTHDPAETPRRVDGALGRRRPVAAPRRADRAQAALAGARGDAGPAQDHADRHRPRQDVRLGAPRGAQAVRRAAGQRRDVRPGRRRGPAHHRRRRLLACSPCDHVVLCAGQESVPRPVRRGARRATSSAAPTSPPSSTRSGPSSRAPGSPRRCELQFHWLTSEMCTSPGEFPG